VTEDRIIEPRRSFGQYEVESVLGQGAMGTVYLARDRRIGRKVALKTVHANHQQFPDPEAEKEFYDRLQREAELCGSLNHPNLVTLYEAGYDKDRISYLATEFVDGESLGAMLKRGRIPVPTAISIAHDLLQGLAYAHSRKIIHRDLKPANILLTREGDAKIADFGIARAENSDLTEAGTLMGTPNYMSPEQVKTLELTPACDLFSLGVVMYEMLAGSKPFAASNTSSTMYKIVHEAPPPLSVLAPEAPQVLVDFVNRLLEKNPSDRFASSSDALAALARIRGVGDATLPPRTSSAFAPPSRPLTPAERKTLWRRQVPPAVFWGTSLLLLATVGGTLAKVTRDLSVEPPPLISVHVQQELQRKKVMLSRAKSLYDSGKYKESAAVYEDYLRQYASSFAATQGRDRAVAASVVIVEKPAAVTQKPPPPAPKEKEKPRGFKDRIRRIFRKSG